MAGAALAAPGTNAADTMASGNALAGTAWRLVAIQSMDDAIGTVRPDDPSLYTMRLSRDGRVVMQLNCNRAAGAWSAEPGADGNSGKFTFGPLAVTRALCPPPSLDERIAAQAAYVRSFLRRDGRLYLSLFADAGILAWEPYDDAPIVTQPDAALASAILQASPGYTRQAVDAGDTNGKARYVYGRCDLNGDGRDEVFAYMLGPMFCGTGGCDLLLFARDTAGYTLLNDFPISRLPVIVSPQKTAGWQDLFRLESGGGMPASYVRHSFDGKRYAESGRQPAKPPPEGRRCLAGELRFDKGIPLEPRD